MEPTTCIRALAIALALLLGTPTLAAGCPIEWRVVGPVKAKRTDLRRPAEASTTRAAWRLDAGWVSTTPELNQNVRTRSGRLYQGTALARQRALGIDAAAPDSNGWKYIDDPDPSTPPCAMAGASEWQEPIVLVREERHRVRVVAAARRTPGDRTGCVLGTTAEHEWGCPTLTRTVIRLKRPLGSRQLVFESFR